MTTNLHLWLKVISMKIKYVYRKIIIFLKNFFKSIGGDLLIRESIGTRNIIFQAAAVHCDLSVRSVRKKLKTTILARSKCMDPFTKAGKAKKTEIISLDYSYVAREQRNKIGIILLIKELLNLVIQKYCNCYEYIVWINKCRFFTFPLALYHVIFYHGSFTIFNDVDDFISISKNFPFFFANWDIWIYLSKIWHQF